ncbi:MAG TPA: flagellar basal-body rod protein FlgF [Hyphomicrobium sp.]|nr:flagellar basal-body rod protein FlgF [Hyphomicrobium sp.]
MQSNIYVTLSAQLALQRRMETVANNVANANTSGFRAEEMTFEQIAAQARAEPTSFVSRGETRLSLAAGEMVQTGNPLDIAIRGKSFFAIQTAGGTTYTRDGRMQMLPTGEITTLTGNPILDVSGSPLQLDPASGPPMIGKDGTITQNGRQIGAIGLFRIDDDAVLARAEGSSVRPNKEPQPELDFNSNGVLQGFTEKSNVNPVLEMTHLIAVQRSFEAVSNVIRESETSLQDAIRALAGS